MIREPIMMQGHLHSASNAGGHAEVGLMARRGCFDVSLEMDPVITSVVEDFGPRSEGLFVVELGISFDAELASVRRAKLSSDVNTLINGGKAGEALKRLEREGLDLRSPDLLRLRARLSCALAVLQAHAPDRLAAGESTSLIALGVVLQKLAANRRAPPSSRPLRGIALMTGHLGAGGAELQMGHTAEMLSAAGTTNQTLAGVKVSGPVHVVVQSLAPEAERSRNFHLPRLVRKNIPVWDMETMAPVEFDVLTDDADIVALLPLLHRNIRRGLCLAPWFRQQKIEVAYIWQDNPILHYAVAALLAGVPRLVLNFRGLPPVLRWNQHLDEYMELYSALVRIPGVTLVTNSGAAAIAYSDWVGCSPDRFHVILNGAARHAPHPSDRELKMWSKFEERTADANITVGGIFRMHPNKRPLEWIRFAHRFLDTHPNARFILIGTGVFFEAVKELAAALGLSNRLLMVRQTEAGEFWLKKMDVFVLLSRYEGTPNVLIEAQQAGVPVVSTPVANAADTFVEGVTGLATASAEFVDVDDVVAKVDRIVAYARAGSYVANCAQRHVATRFSTRSMIEHTVKVLSGRDANCCSRAPARHVELGAPAN